MWLQEFGMEEKERHRLKHAFVGGICPNVNVEFALSMTVSKHFASAIEWVKNRQSNTNRRTEPIVQKCSRSSSKLVTRCIAASVHVCISDGRGCVCSFLLPSAWL